MYKPAVEDLQQQILKLKKHLTELKEENHIYKVKIRKLQDEIKKKDKHLEMMVNPEKASNIKKILTQHGVTLVMKLKQDNMSLQKEIEHRDHVIKKLKWQIDTMKLYYRDRANGNHKYYDTFDGYANSDETSSHERMRVKKYLKQTRSKSVTSRKSRMKSPNDIRSESCTDLAKESYLTMLNANLEIIKQNGSKELKRERAKVQQKDVPLETPHQEIQQLQGCLINILSEVDSLKGTIVNLEKEQKKTHNVMEEKNSNIQKLVHEIENLKQQHVSAPFTNSNNSNIPKILHKNDNKANGRDSDVEIDLSTIAELSISDSTQIENDYLELDDITPPKPMKTSSASVCVQTPKTKKCLPLKNKHGKRNINSVNMCNL